MGLVHIYYGDGKGKTTAAAGLCTRALGSGMRVLFVQFLKDATSSEIKCLNLISGICFMHADKDYILFETPDEKRLAELRSSYNDLLLKAWEKCADCDMIVLDEILPAYEYGFIDRGLVQEFISKNRERLEFVMTGRPLPDELAEKADYISEIRAVKHPYDRGIPAREGIEF